MNDCRERVCWCHDETATRPAFCSSCGCTHDDIDDDVAPYVSEQAKQIAWVDAVRELLGESGRTYAEFRRAVAQSDVNLNREGKAMSQHACQEWSGGPNPENPDNEWICDDCGQIVPVEEGK